MNDSNIFVETDRLRLIPMTHYFISKIIESDLSVYGELGIIKPKAWPEEADIKDVLPMIKTSLSKKLHLMVLTHGYFLTRRITK